MTATPQHTAIADNPLVEAGELVSEYVTYGHMDDDTQFDETFETIASLLPEQLRKAPDTVWRVITISRGEYETLQSGNPILLRPRTFASWSKDEEAARIFLRRRCCRAKTGTITLIVRKAAKSGQGVVDVEALYRALYWNHPDIDEWDRHVVQEREVILRQNDELRTIAPGDIVCAHETDDPEALRPNEGERVWQPRDENFIDIEEVPDGQPYKNQGIWLVVTEDGKKRAIEWNIRFDAWDETKRPGRRKRQP